MNATTWYAIKPLIPKFIYEDLISFYYGIRRLFFIGDNVECPCCKRSFRTFLLSGLGACPGCGAGRRHRNLYYFLDNEKNILERPGLKILHFAPEKGSISFFSKLNPDNYYSADLNSPRANLHFDITHIPFSDNTFDVVISSHVLEHIQNDFEAMKELYRILKPNGYAIHQVPIDTKREKTFEDPNINTNELRDKVYGHLDHKRIYGLDYADRLQQAGFTVTPLNYIRQLSPEIIKKHGLNPSETIYYCLK